MSTEHLLKVAVWLSTEIILSARTCLSTGQIDFQFIFIYLTSLHEVKHEKQKIKIKRHVLGVTCSMTNSKTMRHM
jgi:hypothetical protein